LEQFQFHTSPNGKAAGVISLALAEHRLTVIVLPKLWAPETNSDSSYLWPCNQPHLVISTYELHRFQIEVENETQAEICELLQKAAKTEKGFENEELLVQELVDNEGFHEKGLAGKTDPFSDLFSLCCLYHHANFGTSQPVLDDSFSNKILQLYTMKRFVEELRPLVGFLRQNYLRQVERTSSLRGRITGRGMLYHASTGSLELECEFEDFTTNIPLYRVIVTALSVVQGQTQSSIAEVWNLQRDAKLLGMNLAHIQTYTLNQAAYIGDRLKLNRLEQARWKIPLTLAMAILKGHGLFEIGNKQQHQTLVWNINTAKDIWEPLMFSSTKNVLAGLGKSDIFCVSRSRAQVGLEILHPWKNNPHSPHQRSSTIAPDIVFFDGAKLFCWDAKYKFLNHGPTRDDSYQMFAYSHLVRYQHTKKKESPAALALLYPTIHSPRRPTLMIRNPGGNVGLKCVEMPFPTRIDVQTPNSWNQFLKSLATEIYRVMR
jgi:hypothetical protein